MLIFFSHFFVVKESVSRKTVHLDSPETEKKWSRLAATIGHERLKLKKRKKIVGTHPASIARSRPLFAIHKHSSKRALKLTPPWEVEANPAVGG